MALSYTTEMPVLGIELHTWDNLDTADSSPTVAEPGGTSALAGFVQVVGTFGGGTVRLQGSNDNTNWINLKDIAGTLIGITSDGGAEFSTSARYIRPLITGGSGDDVDVYMIIRG
jgi:ABC-type cobalamin transport system permease subunit